MKRILITLFAIGMTAMSSMSMAAMSNSQIRKETRFLTDKMAYELNLSTGQYNDAYEINFDFIYNVRYLMDDVVRGYEWALEDYYTFLDVRNDDLRWVLSDMQYRRLLGLDYFYRPIHVNGSRWSFRVYINYPNINLFYFGKPYHYRNYCGTHYRTHYNNVSFYSGRYNHSHYGGFHSVRDNRVYSTNRRSDFGTVAFRSNSSNRPNNDSKKRPVPPAFSSDRSRSEGRPANNGRNGGSHDSNSRTNNVGGADRSRSNGTTGRSYHFSTPTSTNGNSDTRKESTAPSRSSERSSSSNLRSSGNESRSTGNETRRENATPSQSTERSTSPSSRSSNSESSRSNSSSNSRSSRSSGNSNSSSSVTKSENRPERSSSGNTRSTTSSSSRSTERGSSSRR